MKIAILIFLCIAYVGIKLKQAIRKSGEIEYIEFTRIDNNKHD